MSGHDSSSQRSSENDITGIYHTSPRVVLEVPVQPPSVTPCTGKSHTTNKQTSARPSIGRAMESEIISCSFDNFHKHYLPFVPDDRVVRRVCRKLKKIPDTTFETSKGDLESTNFDPIGKICGYIVEMKDLDRRKRNDLFYHTVSETRIDSGMEGCAHPIDACLTNDSSDNVKLSKVHAADIIVPFEFKTGRSKKEIRKNRLQIISAAVHTMNDDPRRQFMFAITIEGDLMSVWYFSHSHSAKSQSVDIKKKPDAFVSLMISLLYATREELGFDPNVFWVKEEDAFIYRVHEKWCKVTASIIERRYKCLTGCSTRVFMVKEVKSLDNLNPVDNKEKVLKDLWLDAGARSERQIQLALFEDIKKFAAEPNWKQDPRLKHLSQISESITELEYLFQDKRYENLFLLIADEFAGAESKPIPKQSYYPINLLPDFESTPSTTIGPGSQRLSSVPATGDNPQRTAITKEERTKRSYAPKRRYFMVFDDVCKTVDALPMVGDAFQVLAGCATALRLMYCAGWVHRDISTGNIMAVRGDGGKWNVKLADLEFAKKFPGDNVGSYDPKTGTPFFMPYEILLGKYYAPDSASDGYRDPPDILLQWNSASRPKPTPVGLLHNHQHDLESLFWVLLWLITCRVNHDDSVKWAAHVFQKIMSLHPKRGQTLRETILQDLSQQLRPEMTDRLPDIMDRMREHLMGCMITHSKEGDWKDPKSYSPIHAVFFLAFRDLNNPSQRWAAVALQEQCFAPVHVPLPQFKSMTRRKKRKAADDNDDYNPEPEEGEEDEPVSPTNTPVRGKVSRKRFKVAP